MSRQMRHIRICSALIFKHMAILSLREVNYLIFN
jgi:hypothetical protein